jgi:hypothetical protein
MDALEITQAVSRDYRQVLSATGTDADPLILGWVDRIHKDTLHSSIYNHLGQGITTIATVAGTSSYALSPTDVRRVLLVYDRTFNREILPIDIAFAPIPTADQATPAPGQVAFDSVRPPGACMNKTQGLWPEFYRIYAVTNTGVTPPTVTTTMLLFPAPAVVAWAGTTEVYYEKIVATVSSSTTKLLLPDDAKDVVVAGVNWLTAQYLRRDNESKHWLEVYEKLKRGDLIV